jgi:hypothetical protein
MAFAKTQIISTAPFQTVSGQVNALGYLKAVLNESCGISGTCLVCAGIEIMINLDVNGLVSVTPPQYLWANDIATPAGGYYTVTGYTAAGQPVWGPNILKITSSGTGGGQFDLSQSVPGNPSRTLATYLIDDAGDFISDESGLNLYGE